MTAPLPGRRHLAQRGLWAAAWALLVLLLPLAMDWTWRSPDLAMGACVLGVAVALAWPPLAAARRRAAELDQDAEAASRPLSVPVGDFEDLAGAPAQAPSSWGLCALASGLFGLAATVPFGVLLWTEIGPVPAAHAAWLAIAVAVSAVAGGSRVSRGPAYATMAVTLVAALVLGGLPGTQGEAGSSAASTAPGPSLEPGILWPVSVSVQGPLALAEVRADAYAPLRLRGDMVAGESREARAWMVGPEERDGWDLVEVQGARGVVPLPNSYRCPDWAVRIGPALERGRRGWPWAGLLAAVSTLVLVVAVQRSERGSAGGRGLALAILGSFGSWAVLLLGSGPPGPGDTPPDAAFSHAPVWVYEGRRLGDGSTEWVQLKRAFGVLENVSGDGVAAWDGQVVVGDRRGAVATERDLTSTAEAARIVGPGRDTPIDWRAPFHPGLRLLLPAVNTWGDFEAVWERDSAGAWTALGPWSRGEALPTAPASAALDGEEMAQNPPGWCASALSQGTSVFVGRQKPSPGSPGTRWVRLVGFRL